MLLKMNCQICLIVKRVCCYLSKHLIACIKIKELRQARGASAAFGEGIFLFRGCPLPTVEGALVVAAEAVAAPRPPRHATQKSDK